MKHPVHILEQVAKRASQYVGHNSWLVCCLRPLYGWLLRLVTLGRGIPRRLNGVVYRLPATVRFIIHCSDYESQVATFLQQRVKSGDICFDVGANIGLYVLQFAHWSKPTGQVIAFEPNPVALRMLKKTIAMNGLQQRVTVIPKAVGETDREAVFYSYGFYGQSRLSVPVAELASRSTSISVSIVSLDDYCQQTGIEPDWLLIDIEGFEKTALAGARRLIERRGSRMGIVVEMHPMFWEEVGTNRQQIETFLAELGLQIVPLTGQQDPLAEYGHVYLMKNEVNS